MSAEERRFRAAVAQSWAAAFAVARYEHGRGGRIVQISPYCIRPSFDKRDGFGDDADVRVFKLGELNWSRLEVKRRSLRFTCAADYPYPTIILDRAEKSDAAKPDAYFIVNDNYTHAAIVTGATRDEWRQHTYHDRQKGYDFTSYEAPVELARFVCLAPEALAA